MSTCSESCTAEYNSARRSAMFGCNQARKRFHPYPDCDFMMTSMSDAVTDRFYDGNWHDSFIAGQRSTRPPAVNLRRDTHPKHHDKEARTQIRRTQDRLLPSSSSSSSSSSVYSSSEEEDEEEAWTTFFGPARISGSGDEEADLVGCAGPASCISLSLPAPFAAGAAATDLGCNSLVRVAIASRFDSSSPLTCWRPLKNFGKRLPRFRSSRRSSSSRSLRLSNEITSLAFRRYVRDLSG